MEDSCFVDRDNTESAHDRPGSRADWITDLLYAVSDRSIVNLVRLCEHNGLPYNTTTKVSIAEQQNRFLKDFYQQVQQYSEGKDVLAQVDSDALIGKANLVCNTLKEKSNEQLQVSPNADGAVLRKIADLEEAIVDQVSRRSFCPEFSR
jgi:hypothetical protein